MGTKMGNQNGNVSIWLIIIIIWLITDFSNSNFSNSNFSNSNFSNSNFSNRLRIQQTPHPTDSANNRLRNQQTPQPTAMSLPPQTEKLKEKSKTKKIKFQDKFGNNGDNENPSPRKKLCILFQVFLHFVFIFLCIFVYRLPQKLQPSDNKEQKIKKLKQELLDIKKIYKSWQQRLGKAQKGVVAASNYRDMCLLQLRDLNEKMKKLNIRDKNLSFKKSCEDNGIAKTTGKRLADEYELDIMNDARKPEEIIEAMENDFEAALESFRAAKPLIKKQFDVMKDEKFAETRELSLKLAEAEKEKDKNDAETKKIRKMVEKEEKMTTMGTTVNDLLQSLKKTRDQTDKLLDEVEKLKVEGKVKSKLKDIGDELWDDLTDLGKTTTSFLKDVDNDYELGVTGSKLKEMGLDEESEEEDSDFVIKDAQ